MELILKYFPNLSDTQREQFAALKALYEDWNSKINVISRKDMDNFYEHHVLHSLAIAHEIRFREGTKVLDLGTGGAFLAFHSQLCSQTASSSSSTARAKRFAW